MVAFKTTKWQIHVEIECLTINIFKKKIDIETFESLSFKHGNNL